MTTSETPIVFFVTQRLANGVVSIFGTSPKFRQWIEEEHAILAEYTHTEEAKREMHRMRGMGNKLLHPPACPCGDSRYHR